MNNPEQVPDQAQLLYEALKPLHDPIGVNEERVAHFAEAIGLPPAHHIVYSSRNERALQYIAKQHGLKLSNDTLRRPAGTFHESHNLALSKNDSGQRSTELVKVHEAAHNSIAAPDYITSSAPRERMRWSLFKKAVLEGGVVSDVTNECFSGFNSQFNGAMTEEMWATMIQGAYSQIILSQDQLKIINYVTGSPEVYPERYEHQDGSSYMYGALALEAICDANPDVLDPMFASRKDHTAMYDVATEIDKIEKGLFLQLHNVHLDRDKTWDLKKFQRSYNRVLQAVGVDPLYRERVNDHIKAVHSKNVVAAYISNLLDAYSRQTGYAFTVEPPVKNKPAHTP